MNINMLALLAMGFSAPVAEKDIVDIAVENGNFKTLVALVGKAELVEVLKSAGPFTVLAPSDKAFAKLPKALVEKVTSDKKLLKQVLTYHVISGRVLSTSLKDGMMPKTVEGETVNVSVKHGKVKFNNSMVVTADIKASNGVIHVIDTVLLPPSLTKKH